MVIVYTPRITDRLSYILDEIFTHRLGVSWTMTDDPNEFQVSVKPCKINYSSSDFGGVTVPNSGFLDMTGILPLFKPPAGRIEYQPVLFPSELGIGFDVFSMAFWCLSRYEEYQPFDADIHNRFCSSQSLFSENGFIEAPVLDIALHFFYEKAGLLPPDKYAVYPTLDIDMAYKYKGKGFKRSIYSFFTALIGFNISSVIERIKVSMGAPDPWDTFGYINGLLKGVSSRVRIFVLVAQNSKFDKAVSLRYPSYRKTLKELSALYTIGIHPGYVQGNTISGILEEKKQLQDFIEMPVIRSRHHFLHMQLPDTYRNLNQSGIVHDYTMGFADEVGFRAGTGHSFRFYDLPEEKATQLIVHPFCIMDVTLKNYMGLNPELAIEKVETIKNLCKKYQLPFCFIFHNESLSEDEQWKGWREVFEKCLE